MESLGGSQKMLYEAGHPSPERIAFNFLLKKDECANCCIVEGPSDVDFYSKTQHEQLRCFRYAFIKRDKESTEPVVLGKEAVIKASQRLPGLFLKSLKGRQSFNLAFIVDRDFFGLAGYTDVFSEEERRRITVLPSPYYSHESYFFSKENLKKIFKTLNLTDKDAEDLFYRLYERIEPFLREYFALKSTITYAHSFGGRHKDLYDDERHIFVFTFDKETKSVNFIKGFFDEDVKRMHEYISKDPVLLEKYREMESSLDSPEMYKGHIMFNFLEQFLKTFYDIDFLTDERNYRLDVLSVLKVDLELKICKI